MKILIVKLSAIGDVVHTLPSLSALRRCHPEAEITWVVEEAASDLLAGHPDLDRILISRRKSWIRELRQGILAEPLREMRSFLRELRSRRYGIVIDFHGLFKSAAIVLLSGGRRKVGYDSLQEGSGLFYNEKIPEDLGKHAVDRYLDLIRHVCGPSVDGAAVEFRIAIGEREERRVAALLGEGAALRAQGEPGRDPGHGSARGGGNGQAFAAVSPVAFWETKLWEEVRFAELCDRIRTELGLAVVLTGGDAVPLEGIRRRMKTAALNLGGRTTLRELACLYRRAAVVVTTDSGPMHIAAAAGAPVVALFGPTDPGRTGPYGSGHRVIRRAMPCSPCLRKRCETRACMREISVGEVFEAVREIVGKGGSRGGTEVDSLPPSLRG